MATKEFPCTYDDCDKSYTTKRNLQDHINGFYLKIKIVCDKKLADGTKCKHIEYYSRRIGEHRKHCGQEMKCVKCNQIFANASTFENHCHQICEICSKELSTKNEFTNHLKTHSKWGTRYSLSLENLISNDAKTVKKADELADKMFKRFNKDTSSKKYANYAITSNWVEHPASLNDYVSGMKYFGRDNYKGRTNAPYAIRQTEHLSDKETNTGLIDFYATCSDPTAPKPIIFESFSKLCTNAASTCEYSMIVTTGLHNLCNEANGSNKHDLDIKEAALFGAWLLRESFKRFKKTLIDKHNRIDVSRKQSSLAAAIISLRKQKAESTDKQVLSKEEVIEKLLAEVERVKLSDAQFFKGKIIDVEPIETDEQDSKTIKL